MWQAIAAVLAPTILDSMKQKTISGEELQTGVGNSIWDQLAKQAPMPNRFMARPPAFYVGDPTIQNLPTNIKRS